VDERSLTQVTDAGSQASGMHLGSGCIVPVSRMVPDLRRCELNGNVYGNLQTVKRNLSAPGVGMLLQWSTG
jgi:hypothetical protein